MGLPNSRWTITVDSGIYWSGSPFLAVWFAAQLVYLLVRATFTTGRPLMQMWQMAAVFYAAGLFSFLWLVNAEFGFI